MSDKMRPVPFKSLVERIFSEYKSFGTIFGIHKSNFYKEKGHFITVFGQKCSTPLGPAAGPHTQLAQNIVSSYLTGGRFIELKTVQIMDYLGEKNMISKPCIDARDEGHNVEWSTEYTLEKAYDEYIKAWFILHLLQTVFSGKQTEPHFIFNMSVGYNLDGIKQPKMQTYIDGMANATESPLFEKYKRELKTVIEDKHFLESLKGTDFEKNVKALKGLEEKISSVISSSVTISTMHGCPPKEIEAICTYMLKEKKLNTFVKLNPTLNGYEKVREILDATGFKHIVLKPESFEHDLQYKDAVTMLHRLFDLAHREGLGFGVKLTNTLGNVNNGNVFSGEERYMSGRALLPISTRVAALLSKEFNGKLPISYSGGVSAYSVKDIFDTGIRPITLATDLLKPGGYARMNILATCLDDESTCWDKKEVDPKAVQVLSENSVKAFYSQKAFRGDNVAKTQEKLPMFDCYVSPCIEACPIHARIPDYIGLVGEGNYDQALSVIYDDNALPNITCNICDHQCQNHCARLDYEGPVQIRQMKKIAVEMGTKSYMKQWKAPKSLFNFKIAVVGAGPAGLSVSYFLAREGLNTTIFEKTSDAGGIVANIIPQFRISPKAVEADIDFIKKHGVKFSFNAKNKDLTVEALKEKKFDFIVYAIGAEIEGNYGVNGDLSCVKGSSEFLSLFHEGKASGILGRHVVIVGAGNTAMDCARSAKRTEGVETVTVVYRRSISEMPADYEEYELALKDGVKFCFLTNPVEIKNKKLVCRVMKLGEFDSSGRRCPVETDENIILNCDTLIYAITKKPDTKTLEFFGIPCTEKGWPDTDSTTNETKIPNVYAIGDLLHGPSTVVRCIEDARKASESIICKVYEKTGNDTDELCNDEFKDSSDNLSDDELNDKLDNQDYIDKENEFFNSIQKRKTQINIKTDFLCKNNLDFAKQEANRCMDCVYSCNKCVDVCPNRANIAIDMRTSVCSDDAFQILHIDAFCNECGNCASFCNHQGRPYKDKFTLFNRLDDFNNSTNSGFFCEKDKVKVRLEGKITECTVGKNGLSDADLPEIVKDLIENVISNYSFLLGAVEE